MEEPLLWSRGLITTLIIVHVLSHTTNEIATIEKTWYCGFTTTLEVQETPLSRSKWGLYLQILLNIYNIFFCIIEILEFFLNMLKIATWLYNIWAQQPSTTKVLFVLICYGFFPLYS